MKEYGITAVLHENQYDICLKECEIETFSMKFHGLFIIVSIGTEENLLNVRKWAWLEVWTLLVYVILVGLSFKG